MVGLRCKYSACEDCVCRGADAATAGLATIEEGNKLGNCATEGTMLKRLACSQRGPFLIKGWRCYLFSAGRTTHPDRHMAKIW